jgi:hypothetical protein
MNEQQIKLVMAGVKKDQELAACQADVQAFVEEQLDLKAKRFEEARARALYLRDSQAVAQNHLRLTETVM